MFNAADNLTDSGAGGRKIPRPRSMSGASGSDSPNVPRVLIRIPDLRKRRIDAPRPGPATVASASPAASVPSEAPRPASMPVSTVKNMARATRREPLLRPVRVQVFARVTSGLRGLTTLARSIRRAPVFWAGVLFVVAQVVLLTVFLNRKPAPAELPADPVVGGTALPEPTGPTLAPKPIERLGEPSDVPPWESWETEKRAQREATSNQAAANVPARLTPAPPTATAEAGKEPVVAESMPAGAAAISTAALPPRPQVEQPGRPRSMAKLMGVIKKPNAEPVHEHAGRRLY
jgi:hypothetical protein